MINNNMKGEAIKSRKEEKKRENFGKKYFNEFRKDFLKDMIKIGIKCRRRIKIEKTNKGR